MDENCYVEPIYKNAASRDQLQKADRATLVVWGMAVKTALHVFATVCLDWKACTASTCT
jgi:hypothetical protein